MGLRNADCGLRIADSNSQFAIRNGAHDSTGPAQPYPRRRAGRIAHYIVTKGWVHVVLLSFMGLFLFPFLWMLSTSLKTDEELPEARVLPTIPRFRARSPYVRRIEEPEKPGHVDARRWAEMSPKLLKVAEERLRMVRRGGQSESFYAATVDADEHIRAAARSITSRLVTKISRDVWSGSEPALMAEFGRLMSGTDACKDALANSLGTLELGPVHIRDLSAVVFTEGATTTGGKFAGRWTLESGPGRIVNIGSVKRIEYDFTTSRQPLVLRYDLEMPASMQPDQLHKLAVAIKPDDSWHRIDAVLDWGSSRWESQRTSWLTAHSTMTITFQPPTYDDTTNAARTWVGLAIAGPRTDGKPQTQATLRLFLRPSSTPVANFGKVQRNYSRTFRSVPFWKYVLNSLILVVLTMLGALVSSSWVAYAFARLHWPGRSVCFMLLLSTMMLPGQVTMIPQFVVWKTLHWYNTLNPLWVPAWFGSAFFIFLMTQQMKTIPRELEEAARIDGLSTIQTWWYVMVPQTRPTLAAIAIMTFMGAWNEFMGPLIYLRDQDKFPLSLGLFGMRVNQGADWTMIMAGNMLMTLPVILIFFLFQRYFVQGMTMTGMKA